MQLAAACLTQMNVQLANVISDLSGLTGQLIVRAIVSGERDPQKLAALRDRRIHASAGAVAKSLEGNWRPELLFLVKQEVATYDTYQKRITECDEQLQQQLASFASIATGVADAPVTEPQGDERPNKTKAKRKKLAKNAPRFNLQQELQQVAGVDLTRIDGIDIMVGQTILAEVGLDMGRWKTEGNFVSWLGLCPDNRITGDKVVGRGTRQVVNRAATSLRMAANALLRSQTTAVT
jgi:transposase